MRAQSVARQLVALIVTAVFVGLIGACGSEATPTVDGMSEGSQPAATPTAMEGDKMEEDGSMGMAMEPEMGGQVTMSATSVFTHPDPHHITSGAGTRSMIFWNSLVDVHYPFDPAKGVEYEASLAESWEQDASGKWTMQLRRGVTWHDGEGFDADDVIATFERILDPDTQIHGRGPLALRDLLVGVEKVDDYTVVLDFGGPTSVAFAYISSYLIPIVPEHVIRGPNPASANAEERWLFMTPEATGTLGVGTGPFVMTEWVPEEGWTGTRNDSYFKRDEAGNSLPYLDSVRRDAVPDPTRRLARFAAGRDSVTLGRGAGLHPDKAQELCSTTGDPETCQVLLFPHGFFSQVVNHNLPLFDDRRLVTAIRYAQGHQKIMELAYGEGVGFLWMDPSRFPDTALVVEEQYELLPWSNPDRRDEHVQAAKDLVAEAGYPDGLDLPLPIYSDGLCAGSFLDQYSRIVDDMVEVGIRGTLECREGIVAQEEERAGRFSVDGPGDSISLIDPTNSVFLQGLSSAPAVGEAPWQWPGQDQLDAIYFEAIKIIDDAERNERFRDIERYMSDEALTIFPSGYSKVFLSLQGCVHGYFPGGVWASWGYSWERTWVDETCR